MRIFYLLVLLVSMLSVLGCSNKNKNNLPVAFVENKITDETTFVVFGDCAVPNPPYYNKNILTKIIEGTKSIQPDFIVFLGDGTNNANPSDMYSLKKVFSQLNKPVYVTIGNHDIVRGNYTSNGENNFYKVFKDYMNLPNKDCYYSFAFKDSYFIVLNTAWQERNNTAEHKLKPGSEQWQWLKKELDLANKKYANIIVFTHIPPITWNDPSERVEFNKLMNQYNVKAVFSGHLHGYGSFVMGSIQYVISGGAGSKLHIPEKMGGFYHYLVCTVSNEKVAINLYRIND